jgi:hypothetical protein
MGDVWQEWQEAADTDSAGEFAGWYADETEENFNEQFDSPDALFSSLAQGATGPAPAPTDVTEDGSLDVESPDGYEPVNDAGYTIIDETAETAGDVGGQAVDNATDVVPEWAPYAAAGVGLLLLLAVLRPYASMGAEVTG